MLAAHTWNRTGSSSKVVSPNSSTSRVCMNVEEYRCVPVETARRTVRKGRSEMAWDVLVSCHRSVSRSITAGVGSRATIAPFNAPTLVPSTRSGVTSTSNNARNIPTSAAPSTPPPPSTNAVVMRPSSGRSPRGGELGMLGADATA